MIYTIFIFAFLCLLLGVGVVVWVLHSVLGVLREVTKMAANANFEVIAPGNPNPPETADPASQPLDWDELSPDEREDILDRRPGFAFAEPGSEQPGGESAEEQTEEI